MPHMSDMMPEDKAMPRKKSMPKKKMDSDEMDLDMEEIEKGTKQSTLPTSRRAFSGKKLARPRFGGMMVGQ